MQHAALAFAVCLYGPTRSPDLPRELTAGCRTYVGSRAPRDHPSHSWPCAIEPRGIAYKVSVWRRLARLSPRRYLCGRDAPDQSAVWQRRLSSRIRFASQSAGHAAVLLSACRGAPIAFGNDHLNAAVLLSAGCAFVVRHRRAFPKAASLNAITGDAHAGQCIAHGVGAVF